MRGACLLAALVLMPSLGAADEEGGKKSLEIEAIAVEPSDPGPDTLCQLRVRLRNRGSEKASRFAFEVRIDSKSLPVYNDQLILLPIAPGESTELRLHNFWSSETTRPFPKDGKLTVEVTLLEATWVRVEVKDGVEERTPLGEVKGLPVARRVTVGGRAESE